MIKTYLPLDSPLWAIPLTASFVLFMISVGLAAFNIRYRRKSRYLVTAVMMLLSYMMFQIMVLYISDIIVTQTMRRFTSAVAELSWQQGLLMFTVYVIADLILYKDALDFRDRTIVPMSIKEAVDSLESGLCFYRSDGMIVLKNRAMEELFYKATGTVLRTGLEFPERLKTGELAPGCRLSHAGDIPLVTLADGTVWAGRVDRIVIGKTNISMLIADDVTEVYTKTLVLERANEELDRLHSDLLRINSEIVSSTIQREILNARLRIHDEFGSALLSIRKYLTAGGTEEELRDIEKGLSLNISFLREGYPAPKTGDDYGLLIDTGRTLGVEVSVTGELPEEEIPKKVISTAMHECLTNTIRHAGGDILSVSVTGDRIITAVFTNNGSQPKGPVSETGGLRSLRALTEKAGGTMTVETEPAFTVTITVPREVSYVV
ncbi:MAG: hypothetical protein IJK59_10385 [Firmicutes bacterium]|nr:hypothetical protein [Bacillota bacterium]